jgi:hypothetical protein
MPETDRERLLVLESRVDANADRLRILEAEVHGDGNSLSLRQRVHVLENDRLAAKAAADAIAALRAKERELQAERESRWSWRWKVVATLVAIPTIVIPWFNLVSLHLLH